VVHNKTSSIKRKVWGFGKQKLNKKGVFKRVVGWGGVGVGGGGGGRKGGGCVLGEAVGKK